MTLAQSEVAAIRWSWIADNATDIYARFLEHIQLTVIAVVIGVLISVPLAVYAHRHRWFYGPVTAVTGVLYTIPSLALFAFLLPYTGLTTTTAEIGLVSYTLLILIRNTVAGLQGVPAEVKEAATGMGYTPRQLLWKVELVLALPVIMAGIRLATVTTIGLVTVTALIGKGGLGYFILFGIRIDFITAILLGSLLSLALAVITDAALIYGERRIAPWAAAGRGRRRRSGRTQAGAREKVLD